MSLFMINNVMLSQSYIFHRWLESLPQYHEYSIKCCPSGLAQMLAVSGRYCLSGNPRTKSHRGWYLVNEEVMRLENDSWWSVYVWNAVLAIVLHDSQCEEMDHPAWKWCLQSIHAVEMQDYENPQHIMVPLSFDRAGLDSICSYLFKRIWPSDKGFVKLHQTVTFCRCKDWSCIPWGFFSVQIR